MRHGIDHRKLGRKPAHRKALLRNLMNALVHAERIETTVSKAKELRPLADRLITLGKAGDAPFPPPGLFPPDRQGGDRQAVRHAGGPIRRAAGRVHPDRPDRLPRRRRRRDGDHRVSAGGGEEGRREEEKNGREEGRRRKPRERRRKRRRRRGRPRGK